MTDKQRWLMATLAIALAALVMWQLVTDEPTAVAQNAGTKPLLSEYVGQSCTVHFRRDVFTGAIDVATPQTINQVGRDELSVSGELVALTPEYVIIENEQRERLVMPRGIVLFVELTR